MKIDLSILLPSQKYFLLKASIAKDNSCNRKERKYFSVTCSNTMALCRSSLRKLHLVKFGGESAVGSEVSALQGTSLSRGKRAPGLPHKAGGDRC